MVPICVNPANQLPQGHAALGGDLPEAVPKLVFKADAGLVPCNNNRALGNRRLHRFSPPLDYVTTVSVSTLGLLVCRSLGYKPVRDKPQYASNGDERPNRENSGQLAVLQAIQTQPQPGQYNERGYEYTCNTLRFVVHFLRVAQKLITSIQVLVPGLVLRLPVRHRRTCCRF